MKSMQYTIRAIPLHLDEALRQQARRSGKSLNEVVIQTLERGAGIRAETKYQDLDWLFGKKTLGPEFDEAMEWLDAAPRELG